MTETTDQTAAARQSEQIAWQRVATALLGKLLELAAKEHLPAINWTVVNAGATLHGDCIAYPSHPLRRAYFTAWRDAIAAAAGQAPEIDAEHTTGAGEIRLVARWEWLHVTLTAGKRRDPAAHVTLTASIWPDEEDDQAEEPTARLADSPAFNALIAHQLGDVGEGPGDETGTEFDPALDEPEYGQDDDDEAGQ